VARRVGRGRVAVRMAAGGGADTGEAVQPGAGRIPAGAGGASGPPGRPGRGAHGRRCGAGDAGRRAAVAHRADDVGAACGGVGLVTVLILGGTGEARTLAGILDGSGARFLSSLAGRVSRPRLPAGPVRIGGFGGPDGLAEYLRAEGIRAVVDATHPFAAGISANAAAACRRAGVPL